MGDGIIDPLNQGDFICLTKAGSTRLDAWPSALEDNGEVNFVRLRV